MHVEVVPDLDSLVPRGSDDDGGLATVVELNAGNGISVLVLVNSVLAYTLSVPDLNLVVKTTSNDLSIVLRDSDGQNILLVVDEALNSLASVDVPEADRAVPRRG